MSRKTLLAIIAVIGAALTFLQTQFGLSISSTAVVGGLSAIVLYILFEAKLDIKALKAQPGKWVDPKFWLAFVAAMLVAVAEAFGLNIPVEAITAVLALIMSLLFGKQLVSAKDPY